MACGGSEVIKFAVELLRALWWHLTSPIKVEVTYFQFEDPKARVLPPTESGYHVRVIITNRTDRAVYVTSYSGGVDHRYACPQTRFDKALHLEPHEPKEYSVVLPLEEGSEPIRAGQFSISVWASFGRGTKVSGEFPVGEDVQ